jgi:methylamine---glutamate N-methyltransferase subunit C
MAYGLALSEQTKVAIAQGTARVGTATNTGEGAFSEKERKAAKKLIIQYNRAKWNKTPEILKQADMIEIQLGQGAIAGLEHFTPAKDISIKLKNKLGLAPREDAVIPARMKGVSSEKDLKKVVDYLREITEGVPIGIKMGAGKHLEKDMSIAVSAGVDVITLDGAQAASHGSPMIIQDDFGLPTLLTVSRAGKYLAHNNLKDSVSLIISGGLLTPGDFLKILALGADAVSIGTVALFAVAHLENLKALPFEPPGEILWETGQFKNKFNIKKGAHSLEKFLRSCKLELEEGVRALGKTKISDVNKEDLFTTEPRISAITGVDLAY